MKTLVFFLEEPSAKEMLMGLLPKILPPGTESRFIVFQGKQDLEKNLLKRLRGWRVPESGFIVLRDQDSGDCHAIKRKLSAICSEAEKDVLVRIACRELESFYLGDLSAVEKGLQVSGLSRQQGKSKFRGPDYLENPSLELEKLTGGRYQKISGSRSIAPCLSCDRNASHSFLALVSGIRKVIVALDQ